MPDRIDVWLKHIQKHERPMTHEAWRKSSCCVGGSIMWLISIALTVVLVHHVFIFPYFKF